ncbi:MAG: DNA-directed RNA polymerase subunit A'' [Halodesulfurarchaeum sp.]|nr:DNA-directed RNA polymerase subunit A'' [Halodesulfurarchaeum sp.]
MTAVDDDIEAIVEDTELTRRLKDDVYETIENRSVTIEEVQEIVDAVEAQYLDNRVDPLDPVGTVSAQSIGEPGTQMSVPADERILIRRQGETAVTEIGPLVDDLLETGETRDLDGHEVSKAPADLSVLSLREDERSEWKPVEEVSRHESPDELLCFELESGRTIRATKSHSFVTRQDNAVVPVTGAALDEGDWLPVVRSMDGGESDSLDLRSVLPATEYWYTSTLTDGGVQTATPGGPDQLRNKRDALKSGRLQENAVYPVQGTVGLPERFPLDRETGFFVGAFLAEGNLTDHYVSISNVDPAFQRRIRAFADRFGLSYNEYDNESGFAVGHDIRVNGTILADLCEALCLEDGQKTVPDQAFGAAGAFARGLLRGYFSGDGNVGTNAIRASSRSRELLEGIALLLSRFDIYARFGTQGASTTLRIPKKYVPAFEDRIGMVGDRGTELHELAAETDPTGPDATDQIPNFGDALKTTASAAGIPGRQINAAHQRQRIGRNRLGSLLEDIEANVDDRPPEFDVLERAVEGDVVWERIESVETVDPEHEFVYDVSVAGLETFTTAQGVITHNTMNTFHYAGVAEIDVTQGLPRLIELVDARKEPDTPMMTVHLDEEYATDRDRAHEVVWQIEATKILALGDISTNVADMIVRIDLNEDTLRERWPTATNTEEVVGEIADTIRESLGVEVNRQGLVLEFGPERPSYRELLQLVEELREIVFKGIEEISRVVIRKEEGEDGEEFVLYTEGSAFKDVLDIEGVDASRTTCNNIHEIFEVLGVEAARERIIDETMRHPGGAGARRREHSPPHARGRHHDQRRDDPVDRPARHLGQQEERARPGGLRGDGQPPARRGGPRRSRRPRRRHRERHRRQADQARHRRRGPPDAGPPFGLRCCPSQTRHAATSRFSRT